MRPYPSLRIIFTSPSLRVPGLCQSKLEDHIGGPEHVRESLLDALAQGIGVTAKVSWLTRVSRPSTRHDTHDVDDGASIATRDLDIIEGKARWIHCTPLTGSDGRPGVIMIVMVDKQDTIHSLPDLNRVSSTRVAGSEVTASAPARVRARSHNSFHSSREPDHTPEHREPRSMTSGSASPLRGGTMNNTAVRTTGVSRLYADYMKEVRETQKKSDQFSTRTRDSIDQPSGSTSMATAVAFKAVSGKGHTRKIGGTF